MLLVLTRISEVLLTVHQIPSPESGKAGFQPATETSPHCVGITVIYMLEFGLCLLRTCYSSL